MKQQILDALHDALDWMDHRRYWIAAAIVLVLAVGALMSVPDAPTMTVRSVGPITLAEWTSVADAKAYQVQGRSIDGDWQTMALIWDGTRMTWASIPGPMQYRVRAWTTSGPQRWSDPSQLIFFLPQPMIPRPDAKRQDA